MAKTKSAVESNNRKLTDWFPSSQPPSSSQAPSSSQSSSTQRSPSASTATTSMPTAKKEPISSQLSSALARPAVKALSGTSTGRMAAPMQTATAPKQNQALSRTQPLILAKSRPSNPRRSVKKENAPPPRDVEVLSISSESPTHISISSDSAVSLRSSSIVELTPMEVKRELDLLNLMELSTPQWPRRRSPRLRNRESPAKRRKLEHTSVTDCKRPSPQKRRSTQKKKPIASDDEAIDLDGAEEVIYVMPKPSLGKPAVNTVEIDLATPAPSNDSPRVSRKRARPNGQPPSEDVETEVIPSSQSDERELAMPTKTRKTRREVEERVLAWQTSQKQEEPETPSDHDPWQAIAEQDMILDLGTDHEWEKPGCTSPHSRSQTPPAGHPKEFASTLPAPTSGSHLPSLSTPKRQAHTNEIECNTQLRTPARSSPLLDCLDSLTIANTRPNVTTIPPTGCSKSPPPGLSSTPSTTKVESSTPRTPPLKQITPRPTPLTSPHPTPELKVETPRSKTARLIAKIREEAMAIPASSSEDEGKDVPQTLDSDSELSSVPENFFVRSSNKARTASGRKKTRASTSTALPMSEDSDGHDSDTSSRRGVLRRSRRFASPAPMEGSVIVDNALASTSRAPVSAALQPPTKRPLNPMKRLLREGVAGQKYAPQRKNLLEFRFSPSDEEYEPGVQRKPTKPLAMKMKRSSGSSKFSEEGDIGLVVGEEDRKRLLGEEQSELVDRILAHDRTNKGKGKGKAENLPNGINFWSSAEEGMDVDSDSKIPYLEAAGGGGLLKALAERAQLQDHLGAAFLLQSASFTSPAFKTTGSFLTWLLGVTLCPLGQLSSSAASLLRQLSELNLKPPAHASISPTLELLSSLDVNECVLESLQINLPSCRPSVVDNQQKLLLLKEFADIIGMLGKAKLLESGDIPVYIALLIAIGMDEKADRDLKIAVSASVNALCVAVCGEFANTRGEMERKICLNVASFAICLSSGNKVLLLSFLNGACPVIRRIAQWVAFAMLTSDYGVKLASDRSESSPALSDIQILLDPEAQESERWDIFHIPNNCDESEEFDYVALGHHIEILGRVLMNVSYYLRPERRERGDLRPVPAKSILGEIGNSLERLGSKIVDTRAAHPDRSITKATIQRLKMRLHYQFKEATSVADERGNPLRVKKLDAFFQRSSMSS